MSDIVPATSGGVAAYSGTGAVPGLEDFDAADQVMPTLRIEHSDAEWVDGLSNQTYKDLEVVILGLVKQRTLWPATIGDEKQFPLCRSYNFSEGHPSEDFPYDASGFSESSGPVLPCNSCKLKEWGTHPTREAPWCTEQHTFAAMMLTGDGGYAPCLLSLQRSALKPSKQYISSFQNRKQPLFTVYTKIELEKNKKGGTTYSVPKFTAGAATDATDHPFFAQNYYSIREFLQTPRVATDDADDADEAPVAAPTAAPAAGIGGSKAKGASAAPAAATAPVKDDADEDDLPF